LEDDAREITSNLSNSFMTMDTAGMLRQKLSKEQRLISRPT
jgi:hypothetical protein